MFDVDKVCRMTDELKTFVQGREEIYFVTEIVSENALALFRRFDTKIRAIIFDEATKRTEAFGIPVITTAQASKNFSERTGLIVLVKKALPIFQTEMPFDVNGRRLNVPTFIMSSDEILAIYDRLTLIQVLQQYKKDGLTNLSPNRLAQRFARGLTTFLDPDLQEIKIRYGDKRNVSLPKYDFSDAAIVLQGPIVYENNYTAKTAKLYRSLYPNAPIVISTWTGEATDDFRKACRENTIVLIESVLPKKAFPWITTVNFQIESSYQGIKYIRENTDAKFVLKTRCDQRFNRPDFLLHMKNTLATFAPLGDKLKQRLIVPGDFNGGFVVPFNVCDYFSFGTIDDMTKLYDIPHDTVGVGIYHWIHRKTFRRLFKIIGRYGFWLREPVKHPRKLKKFNLTMSKFYTSELYIIKKFYETHIAPIEPDKILETYHKFLRDYLIVMDNDALLFDWPKYDENYRYNMNSCFWFEDYMYWAIGMNHSQWLDLYKNFESIWGK